MADFTAKNSAYDGISDSDLMNKAQGYESGCNGLAKDVAKAREVYGVLADRGNAFAKFKVEQLAVVPSDDNGGSKSNSVANNSNNESSEGGFGGALLGLLALAGAGYAAYKGVQNYNEEKENERQRIIAEQRRAEMERMKKEKSPFQEFMKSAFNKIQEMNGKTMNSAAEIMYRKCNGDISKLRRIARGEDPRVPPNGVKAAQMALKERNYRW